MAKSQRSTLPDPIYDPPLKPPPSSGAAAPTNSHSRCNPSPPSSPARGALSSAPKQSCAACKHQRRQCTAGCILAPHFPGDLPRRFRNAHRLFGVKNILRLLEAAGPEKRQDCARSIIYESNARAERPVDGCVGVIRGLHDQCTHEATELDGVLRLLDSCRATCGLPQPQSPYPPTAVLPMATAAHEPEMYDDDQGHARMKMMRANGEERKKEVRRFLEDDEELVYGGYQRQKRSNRGL